MSKQIPVGMERVLYLAATDRAFFAALFADRAAAVEAYGMVLRDTERSMLESIPVAQLRSAIAGLDSSPKNLRRRTFMAAVAASAATVAAAGTLGCGDDDVSKGIRPDMPQQNSDGRSDTVEVKNDGGPAPTGIRPGG